MPRDASGNYTLPAGNPVVTGTVITSSWANPTMSDIAQEITNSLSRDGQGGMLAPLQFADGTVNDPSVAFINEPTLGFYREGAGRFSIAGQGKDIAIFDASTGTMILGSGAAPAIVIQPDIDGSNKIISFNNAAGDIIGQVFLSQIDEFVINRYDETVTLLSRLTFDVGGNVGLTGDGTAPVEPEHITRKDYVDALSEGFLPDGLHEEYTGDLDALLINSVYNIVNTSITNAPPEWVSSEQGFIYTDMRTTTRGIQVIHGIINDISRHHQMWMRIFNATWGDWKLVVDGGAFTERLAGYDDNGQVFQYQSDLNLLLTNSAYYIVDAQITNGPVDFTQDGFIISYAISGGIHSQLLYGRGFSSAYKQWQRMYQSGAWEAWKLVVDGSSLEFDANGQALLANAPTEDAAATRKDYVDSKTFPAGTRMLFVQTAAPTGWTKLVDQNDKAIRIVSGSVTIAGALPFSTVFGRTAVDGHAISIAQMPAHDHNGGVYMENLATTIRNGIGASGGTQKNAGAGAGAGVTGVSDPIGSGDAHAHNIDMRVQYVDVIYATKI